MEFMRKYIHVAKIVKPVLTQGAASHIAEEYSRLRSQEQLTNDVARTSPVTARSLETMIRLSTAHAKARMSKSIELQDAEVAVELVQFAYFKKVLEKEKKRRRQDDGDTETEGEDEEGQGDGGNEEATPEHRRKRSCRSGERRRPSKEGEVYDPYDFGDKEEDTPDVHNRTPKTPEYQEEPMETRGDSNKLQLADARLKEFKVALLAAFKSAHAQSISLHNLMDTINKGNEKPFSQGEVLTALEHMQDDNQVMVSDEIIFLI